MALHRRFRRTLLVVVAIPVISGTRNSAHVAGRVISILIAGTQGKIVAYGMSGRQSELPRGVEAEVCIRAHFLLYTLHVMNRRHVAGSQLVEGGG